MHKTERDFECAIRTSRKLCTDYGIKMSSGKQTKKPFIVSGSVSRRVEIAESVTDVRLLLNIEHVHL